MLGVDPREVNVPVVGGHAGITILPLLSQVSYGDVITLQILILTTKKNSLVLWIEIANLSPISPQVSPPCSFTPDEISYLTNRIQNGGTEVVEV